MTRRLAPLLVLAALLALPAVAGAAAKQAPPVKPEPAPNATVKIDVGGLHGGKATIWDTVPVRGTVFPYAPGQQVEVVFYLDGKPLVRRKVAVRQGPNGSGSFESSVIVREDGKYAVSAKHAATPELGADETVRKSWKVEFPGLKRGECSKLVEGFKRALAKLGYVSGGGRCFDGRLGREVLAYRKVNDMDRSKKAGPGVVKAVYGGSGAFHLKYPGAGKHVEVDISKQVMVLAKHGKPQYTFHVSTGAPVTPTIRGHYEFYRRDAGYNSEGMYYSFYWHNGYAVHGYHEVPNYAASHGCVRTFIADQPRIYEQLHYGESIFVF